ncbi:hypothetical protein [Nocardia sp. 852002-51101_SCH5132738]|uniref:hypothetical protein n=1 Tax=Nocardia sp. 852002-51101_SCH5132738 TaxID=1834095 RepID=UPI000A7FD190|nr:hypothetical protein [Nocardia sp. 852002-51101_SCH5132738]
MSAINEQLHRRAAAARRLPGGDPWPRTVRELDLSTHQLSAWSSAVNHIASDGVCPIVPREVLELLWQRGGADRELAEQIHERGGAAA